MLTIYNILDMKFDTMLIDITDDSNETFLHIGIT